MGEQIGKALQGTLYYVPKGEFDRVAQSNAAETERAALFANLCRVNALYMIARAGSGHIGSSFSSLDIVSWLYLFGMAERDVYFSSKGHDAPGLYALLMGLGRLPFDNVHKLRRLDGLPGHPDVAVPGMVVNSGSLGMGISKAKGMVRADRLKGMSRRYYVMTGDGELQEGQIWESLASAVNDRLGKVTVVVDHNKFQSDYRVSRTSDLGDLEAKFAAFGWHVERCDGHDMEALSEALRRCASVSGRPQVVIADTIKGRGVSFMEHTAMESDAEMYRFHSGAPAAEVYRLAVQELLDKANAGLDAAGLERLTLEPVEQPAAPAGPAATPQKLIPAYTEALLDQAARRPEIVALDADLVLDTGLIPFRDRYPERFVECGIAEMDMVSQAGGLALNGMLPICHSFGCFLSTRPNEQIYNNATERTKILYVGSLVGLIPAGPGHSHQSLRDISAVGSVPRLDVVEPCCAAEVAPLLDYLLTTPGTSGYMRLISVPWEVPFAYPAERCIRPGQGLVLTEGADLAIAAYGMIPTSEAYRAAGLLKADGIHARVISMPFLNRFDGAWLRQALGDVPAICTIDNHYVVGGFGDLLLAALAREGAVPRQVLQLGIEDVPASGQTAEVLRHHGLDAESLRDRLREEVRAVHAAA